MKKLVILLCISILLILILYPKEKNIIYIPNFLSTKDFNIIKKNLNKKNFKNELFRKVKPLNNQRVNDIFYSSKYLEIINKYTNKNLFKSRFPIEHRIYPKGSKGMYWHIDTLMYDLPQYEAVFTIHNNSDSVTEWIDNIKHGKWTEPNSLLLVKAQGDYHHVTPITKGNREILKLIYTQSKNENNNFYKELKRFKFLKVF